MTDHFSKLYAALLPHEQKKCNTFFAKQDGEKEKALFAELKKLKDRSSEELAAKIYNDKSKVGSIRQLKKQVTDKLVSIVQDQFVSTEKGSASIRRLIDFADFLISRHCPSLALAYLEEAEEEAKAQKAYDLLENIYFYKLNHTVALGLDANEVFAEWQQNHQRYVSFMHLTSARGVLVRLLDDHRRTGVVPKQDELMAAFYERFTPNEEESRNPEFMIGLAHIFRQVMLSTKDYWRIEPAIQCMYNKLLDHGCFTPKQAHTQRSFLLMLAQACYRNIKFEEAENYLKEVQALLPVPVSRNDPHYIKLQSQRAAIYTYTDRCPAAIELLRKHLYGPNAIEDEVERNNMVLNLAVNYFCLNDYTRALEQWSKLDQSDSKYFDLMGLEWAYKRRMIGMILHHCCGHFEEAEKSLVAMLSDFDVFLKQELYSRAGKFMHFLLRWFRNPELIHSTAFHQEVKEARLSWGEEEDMQAIFFFSWFRAAMLGQKFYPTFLARLRKEGPNWDYPFDLQ